MLKNFVGEPFSVSLISGTEIVWIREGGEYQDFSVENFSSHSAENFRRGILYCCNNFGYRKSLDKGGGYHDFPSKFLSHCTEIFHWRTLWCFRKILLSKNFMHSRGGGITVLAGLFVSQDRNEKLCIGTLLFSEIFWYRKKFMDKRVHITISVEIFMSHSGENFRKNLLFLRKFLVSKVLWMKRGYHVFPSKIFGLTVPKNFVGIPSMFQKIWGIEKFYA